MAVFGQSDEIYERVRALSKMLRVCPIVVLAQETGIDLAIRLIRLGISDVIEIPSPVEDVLAKTVRHFADFGESTEAGELVGQSPPMRELRERIAAAARVGSTVLLQGETGTGKGLVARLIHARSNRRDGPFGHVDCTALSPTLIESELFGHEKGAFTGAAVLKPGRLEMADQGTIFLDEIGDLEPPLQSKLLRLLEDRTYERVGGTRTLRMRARVIAATSRNLLQAVHQGRFRQDLYFRLNVLSFYIPPLRERLSDIPVLVQAGLRRLAPILGVPIPRVSDDFCAALAQYSWPGNVRELMNVLERLLVQQRAGPLDAEDLASVLETHRDTEHAGPLVKNTPAEAASIRAALIETGGNVTRAARRLGIARGTLRYRIRKYGLDDLIPDD
jgi:DNA-binding NtrC family response regulator